METPSFLLTRRSGGFLIVGGAEIKTTGGFTFVAASGPMDVGTLDSSSWSRSKKSQGHVDPSLGVPSGKMLQDYGKSPFLMDTSTMIGPFSIANC